MYLTVGITYYDNYDALLANIKHYKNFTNYKFILVDDGSPIRPLKANDVPDHWSLYRVTEDVGWNNEGCRNLIAHVCETEWLCLIDIDRYIKDNDMNFYEHDKDYIYFLADIDWNFKDKPNYRRRVRGALFDHNTFFTTKEYFWKCGGYDETYLGYYGMDGTLTNKPWIKYNVSEYEMIFTRNIRGERTGSTNEERKHQLGKGLDFIDGREHHDKKLTFPWIKIK
jgi:hypothetical protein